MDRREYRVELQWVHDHCIWTVTREHLSAWARLLRALRRAFDNLVQALRRAYLEVRRLVVTPELEKRRKRAMGLLESLLTPVQRADLRRFRHFKVQGASGTWYQVTLTDSCFDPPRNIAVVSDYTFNPVKHRWTPPGEHETLEVYLMDEIQDYNEIPEDRVIAQLLLLQTDDRMAEKLSC